MTNERGARRAGRTRPDGSAADEQSLLSDQARAALRSCLPHHREGGAVVVCGFPGSGKTTAARYAAECADAVLLDKDTFAPLLEETVTEQLTGDRYDRDSATYRAVVAPGIYDGLIRTGLAVAARCPVVLDAPFLSPIRAAAEHRRSLAEHFRLAYGPSDAPITTIWIDAPVEVVRERIVARGLDRDRPKLADWDSYRAEVLDSGVRETAHAVVDLVIVN
ncbi:ATP-binding protein [Nocardia cyriacigeorgica]|uniref:AAA family ATPase n=1 Tax=Nocardia cyriacigeorgica TaxID=135487 RepID=UPI0018960EC7|nr:ATP-binding protein [Nocardia cyriacigeorgica]MBF6102359.1 ATP-binding protein [Nocardia cyriacigeorgica]MBF6163127.1 ATP-binding protein [Nocardia cyriacigeorgica]MBF6202096.1 ATP-binding protein [Nocardia cyriacigeorgica]MBF6518579.1 ATP-binding protein [Nocardia cyriacigeorgica]